MPLSNHSFDHYEKLKRQVEQVERLNKLPFDNTSYNVWRCETGDILAEIFPDLDSERHPCVQAFLAYRIPEHFTASRVEMQELYLNILRYQSSLLVMYCEDLEEPSK